MNLTARRHEALYAMAHADESPHERDRARDILDAAGVGWREPPRRPPAAPAPSMPGPDFTMSSATTSTGFGGSYSFVFTVRVG